MILLTKYFNPLPPHGGRLDNVSDRLTSSGISIHSLRMEGDAPSGVLKHPGVLFQSTPSAWRETSRLFRLRSGK